MVVAVLMFVAAFILSTMVPTGQQTARGGPRIVCVNNVKQIGLAYRVWEGDNNDTFPMGISETNGGAMELFSSTNAWRFFQVMSNELSTPKVLWCPAETDRNRFVGTNFEWLNNSNLSFFVGLVTNDSDPQMILSGDHNITNGTALKNGVLGLTASRPTGWTAEMHDKIGNIGLADGSVQQVNTAGLQTAVAHSGVATNSLLMPILEP